MRNRSPIHLLIRFSDNLFQDIDTINEHLKVINQNGAVWFGKMGSTIAQQHIDIINHQCAEGIHTYIYLVKGHRRTSTSFRCLAMNVGKSFPKKEEKLIPKYYYEKEILKYIKFWAKLSNITLLKKGDLQKIRVASSIYPIGESLYKSSSGHFIVKEI